MVRAEKQSDEVLPEAETIRRVCSGHKEEFTVLVERYQNSIYAMIFRQVQNHTLAEELAQESFVRAYKSLASFKGKASFQTWLTRIALNVTNSYFSSRRYKEQKANVTFDLSSHEHLLANTEAQYSQEELALISQALSSLAIKQREALSLVFLEGKSYQEAGEILEIPVGTVSSRITKGIAELKAILKGAKI